MTDYVEVSNDYSSGYYVEGDPEDPYSSGWIAGVGDITTRVTGELAQRVLARTGKTGEVTIIEHHWDMGYCVTCSSEVVDFLVKVNGEIVYETPRFEFYGGDLSSFTSFGHFNDWLSGAEDQGDDW